MRSFPRIVVHFVRRSRAARVPLALGLALLLVCSAAFPQKIHEDTPKRSENSQPTRIFRPSTSIICRTKPASHRLSKCSAASPARPRLELFERCL